MKLYAFMTTTALAGAEFPGPSWVAGMDDSGRPASLIAWVECDECGRIDKPAHDFNYPPDMASDMELFVWLPCEKCGRLAKLHMKRELKPLQ